MSVIAAAISEWSADDWGNLIAKLSLLVAGIGTAIVGVVKAFQNSTRIASLEEGHKTTDKDVKEILRDMPPKSAAAPWFPAPADGPVNPPAPPDGPTGP